MRAKITVVGFLLLFFILFIFLQCGKEFAFDNPAQARNLLNEKYPKKIEQDYNLVIRLETNEPPALWNNFKWKNDNDYLQKCGLLRQIIKDTVISFYDHKNARFINKQHFLYKVELTGEITRMMNEPQYRYKRSDEFDYYNRHTRRMTFINCKALCAVLNFNSIIDIAQKEPPYSTEIKFTEKVSTTPFNDIINYHNKFSDQQIIPQTILAKKYSGDKTFIED